MSLYQPCISIMYRESTFAILREKKTGKTEYSQASSKNAKDWNIAKQNKYIMWCGKNHPIASVHEASDLELWRLWLKPQISWRWINIRTCIMEAFLWYCRLLEASTRYRELNILYQRETTSPKTDSKCFINGTNYEILVGDCDRVDVWFVVGCLAWCRSSRLAAVFFFRSWVVSGVGPHRFL